MTTDMTEGRASHILWRFSLPLLISIIFQQLYNIADSVVAGQFIGEGALAAVGASYPITMIFMAVASGSNVGCSVIISQLFGAKDIPRMKTAVLTALWSMLAVSALFTVVGFLTASPLLKLLGTPENIFEGAELYLQIYIGGLAFLFFYNICTGVFTALGDSRTPLYFLIASSLGNIAMDILFVAGFRMDIAGVAWATFLCQGVAAVLAFFTLLRRMKAFQCEERPAAFSWFMLGRIASVAVPSVLQASFVSVGNLFIQRLVNAQGSSVIAGYSAAIKLNTFALTAFSTFASGVSTFAAQNLGAGKVERVKHGFRAGTWMSLGVAVPFILAYCVFAAQSMRLFLSDGEQAIAAGVRFLHITAPFYPVIMIKLTCDAVLRGAGSMREFMITTFADLILRVAFSYLFASFWGEIGIWLSWPIGWSTGTLLSILFYLRGKWRSINVLSAH